MRSLLLKFALLIAVLSPVSACSEENKAVLHTSTGEYTFNIDIAETQAERSKGLMFVQELADDAGMLFDFQEERPVAFWMRNTFIPLDMIFIEADGTVKNVHVNAIPHDPTSIPSDGPVRFVLEIPGGRSREIGLEAGDKLEHPRVEAGE